MAIFIFFLIGIVLAFVAENDCLVDVILHGIKLSWEWLLQTENQLDASNLPIVFWRSYRKKL